MSSCDERRLEKIRRFLEQAGLSPASLETVEQALTHRSYAFENDEIPDNERLEFLGDAILGCLAAHFLFEKFPQCAEGSLSKMKSFLVSRTELASRGDALGIDAFLLVGRGVDIDSGRNRTSIVGSALEALIGALYLDGDFEALKKFVWDRVLSPGMTDLGDDAHLDHKSLLQELLQRHALPLPQYEKTGESGPPHDRTFSIRVVVQGRELGIGEGARIKEAEDYAARAAYLTLKSELEC